MNGKDMTGGFFGLELPGGQGLPYAEGTCCAYLSSGRAALECLLRSMPRPVATLRRALVPRFCCDTVLQPFQRVGLPVVRYGVDDSLRPLLPDDAGEDDLLLLVNYFGFTGAAVAAAAASHAGPVVVDATTALYCPPVEGIPVFYSLRKFGAVPDGGIACAPFPLCLPAETDSSAARALYMLERAESGALAALPASERAEVELCAPAKCMSPLTRRMAASIDWQAAARTRRRNYRVLHKALGGLNRLALPDETPAAPSCYPLFTGIPGLRDALVEAGVALPLYWPEVIEATRAADTENRLTRTLLPLPLDQRYSENDMVDLCALILG